MNEIIAQVLLLSGGDTSHNITLFRAAAAAADSIGDQATQLRVVPCRENHVCFMAASTSTAKSR